MWTEVCEVRQDHTLQTIRPRCVRPVSDRYSRIAGAGMSGVVQANSVEKPSNASRPNPDLLSRPLTDSGNGERLVQLHGKDVRYCPEYKAWFSWDGKRWKRDGNGRVYLMAKEVARKLYTDALAIPDSKEREKVEGHARRSENAKDIRAKS